MIIPLHNSHMNPEMGVFGVDKNANVVTINGLNIGSTYRAYHYEDDTRGIFSKAIIPEDIEPELIKVSHYYDAGIKNPSNGKIIGLSTTDDAIESVRKLQASSSAIKVVPVKLNLEPTFHMYKPLIPKTKKEHFVGTLGVSLQAVTVDPEDGSRSRIPITGGHNYRFDEFPPHIQNSLTGGIGFLINVLSGIR